jgi:hypothetical protein
MQYAKLKAGHVYSDVPIPRLPRRGNVKKDDTSHLELHQRLVTLNPSEMTVVIDINRATIGRVINSIRGERDDMMFITRRLADDKYGVWRVS